MEWPEVSELAGRAHGGNSEAMVNLLDACRSDCTLIPQHPEIIDVFLRAAESGDRLGQYCLGLLHYKGLGVPEEHGEALYWLSLAAEQGLADAQFNLGLMYHRGRTGPIDYCAAYFWVSLAAISATKEQAQGYVDYGAMIGRKLTAQQRAEVQSRVQEWSSGRTTSAHRLAKALETGQVGDNRAFATQNRY